MRKKAANKRHLTTRFVHKIFSPRNIQVLVAVITIISIFGTFIPARDVVYAGPVENTFTMPGTGDDQANFDDAGYDNGSGTTFVLSTEVTLGANTDWWNTNYLYRRGITLTNLSSESFAAGTPTQITLDTKALFDSGKIKDNCQDMRIIHYDSGSYVSTEIARSFYSTTGGNCSVATSLVVTFPLFAELAASTTDSNYFVYYGYSGAVDPAYGDDGYNVGSTNATLVAPYNGSTTGIDGETATETGSIRYSGSKSGLNFDGKDDVVTFTDSAFARMRTNFTYEAWVRPLKDSTSTTFQIVGVDYNYWALIDVTNTYFYAHMRFSDWSSVTLAGGSAVLGNWYHLALSVDGTTARFYVNGTMTDSSDISGKTLGASNQPFAIGRASSGTLPFGGDIDEVRVSNIARYTSNFTPQTSSFASDANTLLLLHLDENGSDPRNAGKAIDASGNARHGTISGATYVSGLVGVDASGANTGAVSSQSYAGHQGVFLEEATLNKITNPSFENTTSWSTNWGLPYFKYAVASSTFTPTMGKRNSYGPFALGPIIQGKLNAIGSTDSLTYPKGTQVASDFYTSVDPNQGSIVFWITPEWNGSDVIGRFIYYSAANFYIFKSTTGNLVFQLDASRSVSKSITDWVAGNTYCVVIRWDYDNTLDGTNYASISVDDVTTSGVITAGTVESFINNIDIGSFGTSYGGTDAIIEGFTMYRRPLWDGVSGIDVGNGDEVFLINNGGNHTGADNAATLTDSNRSLIASSLVGGTIVNQIDGSSGVIIANTTTTITAVLSGGTENDWDVGDAYIVKNMGGVDPTLVTGSWDVVLCVPTDANSTTALTTGQAWSHPFGANVLGPTSAGAGQGKDGFFMEGYYGSNYVEFNGTSTSVNAGSDAGLDDLHNQVTIEGWFRPDTTGETGAGRLFSKGGWQLTFISATQMDAVFDYDGSDAATRANISANILDGRWHHLAVTYNEGGDRKAKIWVDGVEGSYSYSVASTGNYVSDAANNLMIGARYDGLARFDGGIGWVRVSNTVRYSSTFTPSVVAPGVDANTIAQWNMAEGSGTAIDNVEGTAGRDGVLANGTWVNSWWQNVGTPTSGTFLPTNQKIYKGGILLTSDAADEGTKKVLTGLTAGQNYLVRAEASSDATSVPKIQIWDVTNNHELAQITGTNTSSRIHPNVLMLSFELPTVARYAADPNYSWVAADTTSIEVRLINTQATGTVYWHQAELIVNLVDNPSLELAFTGDPGIPVGFVNGDDATYNPLEAGDIQTESSIVHSGFSSVRYNASFTDSGDDLMNTSYQYITSFYSVGGFSYGNGTAAPKLSNGYRSREYLQTSSNTGFTIAGKNAAEWKFFGGVSRVITSYAALALVGGNADSLYVDDVYHFPVTSVTLTPTTPSSADSTETSGLRVDGKDTLSVPLTGITAEYGSIKFKFTPRHNYADAAKFGQIPTASYPAVFSTSQNGSNQITLFYETATSMLMRFNFGGVIVDARWNASAPVLNAGTTYNMEISYARNGLITLKVDGVVKASNNTGDNYFSALPGTAYFGTNVTGWQYDCTIADFTSLTPTVNTSYPYFKFGSKSAKLVANAGIADEYGIFIDPDAATTHMLSAYVYNGTAASIGGTVDNTIAELFFNGSTITTTYTDMGGGWWRLTGSLTAVDSSRPYGIQVKAGKTVYVDGVQLEAKAYATSYADGSLGAAGQYDWTVPASPHNSTSSRTSGLATYAYTGEVLSNEGSFSIWYRPNFNWDYLTSAGVMNAIFNVYKDGSNYLALFFSSNTKAFSLIRRVNNTNHGPNKAVSFNANNWLHIVGTWDATSGTKLYINNSAPVTDADTSSFVGGSNIQIGSQARGVLSDMRFYDKALTAAEVADLYYMGQTTHSNAAEESDRYPASGTYTTPSLDLGNVSAWSATDDFGKTETLNGGAISYQTATSANNADWDAWQSLSGNEIQSTPHRYMKVKATITPAVGQSASPKLSGLTVNYVPDSTPPSNPSVLVTSPGVSGGYFNDTTPTFTWPRAEQAGGSSDSGEGSSGVKGYHVYFGTNNSAVPYSTITNKWFVDDPGSGDVEFTLPTALTEHGTYYLRIQAEDNAGNYPGNDPEDTWQPFIYQFEDVVPVKPLYIGANPSGYARENQFTFSWPAGTDSESGVWGYCYHAGIGAETCEAKEDLLVGDHYEKALTDIAYQAGANLFYVRTKDNAGNYSDQTQVTFYWNSNAPSEPINVIATLSTDCTGSEDNCWVFSWDAPLEYTERIVKYYYSVNSTPTIESPYVEGDVNQTPAFAAGTRQGENDFYVVAEDVVAVNFGVQGTTTFTVNSTAPAIPENLMLTDTSNREESDWALTSKWSTPTEVGSGIDHYNIYKSEDGVDYTICAETQATGYLDTGLSNEMTYYYKVSASDNAGAESGLSAEVSAVPVGKYTQPPLFGGTPTATVTAHVATVQWTTDRPSASYVEYGLTTDYELGRVGEDTLTTAHKVVIRGLSAESLFHYRVQSLDDGDERNYPAEDAYSSDYTFATLKAPDITEVNVTDITLSAATISWVTTTISTSEVHYGVDMSYGGKVTEESSALTTNHMIRLAGLNSGTTYHFKIVGRDADGVEIYSEDNLFGTIPLPLIQNLRYEKQVKEDQYGMQLDWTTNVAESSVVRYWPRDDESKLLEDYKSDMETTHSMFITGLLDNTVYKMQVQGRDTYGNLAESEVVEFTTDIDTRPPVITKLVVETANQGTGKDAKAQIVVSWETNEPSTSQVEYGIGVGGQNYTARSLEDTSMNKVHVIILSDLKPGTPYSVRAVSKDAVGNTGESLDYTIVTKIPSESVLDIILSTLRQNFGWLGEF